jgi:hypothetical protein
MRSVLMMGAGACALVMCAACGSTAVPRKLVLETGCVTGSGNEFILTDLEDRADAPGPRTVTDAYLLLVAEDALRSQVGRRVTVTGTEDPKKVVDIRVERPMVRADASDAVVRARGGSDSKDPRIETGHQLRLEVSRLNVMSVEPKGEWCTGL